MKSIVPLAFAAAAVAYPTSSQDAYLVSLGPRPYYLINNMTDSPLKQKLESCKNKPVTITDFSIGHRGGGTLQFPEETVQSEDAGARMGAGVLECDVSFTADRGLVCRHSLCDLHTTTDILLRPELAKKCTQPFTPANGTASASALCCTSDITTAECTQQTLSTIFFLNIANRISLP
jgi:glycerophosphoryl diester phosphodiesterase